jgi:fucose 4-O-acetylase-like acetyltransferase
MKSEIVRDPAADVIRGIAIVLVVLGHVNRGILDGRAELWQQSLSALDFCLYSVHMPAFFYVAGYFTFTSLQRRAPFSYIVERWNNIIYPYIVWSCITAIIHYLMVGITKINHHVTFDDLINIWWRPINILWFLYALLVMQLVSVALKRRPGSFIAIALCAAGFATIAPDLIRLSIAGKTAFHMPYFAIGFAIASRGLPMLPIIRSTKLNSLLLAAFWSVGCALAIRSGFGDPSPIFFTPLSLIGVAMLTSFASLIVRTNTVGKHISALGKASLPIYLMHSFALATVPRLANALHICSVTEELIVGTLFGVYASLLAYFVTQRAGLDGLLGFNSRKNPFRSLFLPKRSGGEDQAR